MLARLCPRNIVGSSLSVAACLLVVAASSLAAQTTAALQGRVFDASGGVIPGASITLRDGSTRFALSAHANADGRYSILSIPAGTYTVEASAAGLRSEIIESLTVEVDLT
jgi:hypothetical protein